MVGGYWVIELVVVMITYSAECVLWRWKLRSEKIHFGEREDG
jgi:hypothetical protein